MTNDHECLTNHIYDDIEVGQGDSLERVLTRRDIQLFAVMSGDVNPAHLDDAYAESSAFHGVIAHGMWTGALFSTLLGTQFPGPGTIYLSQQMKFHQPVHIGDTLKIQVSCVEKADRQRLRLSCLATNQKGARVVSGEAWVIAPGERIQRPRPVLPDVQFTNHRSSLHDYLTERGSGLAPIVTAVVHPMDATSLLGAIQSQAEGLIDPWWIAPKARLLELAEALGVELDLQRIIDVPFSHAAAEAAVDFIRDGRGEAIMKGKLHTDELMKPILDKAKGLRTERRMSHVFAMDTKRYTKPLYITDCALNIRPNLNAKRDICQNAIDLFSAVNARVPKVAILAAVETVDANMPSTLDATALCKMAERGQITGGLLDGPLAMDNALSAEAAAIKGIVSQVAGDADVLLCPDLESGNMLFKQMSYLTGAEGAGIVLGARVPIILTSRSSSADTRVCSAAMAKAFLRVRT